MTGEPEGADRVDPEASRQADAEYGEAARVALQLHATPMRVGEITRMMRGYGFDVDDIDVTQLLRDQDVRPRNGRPPRRRTRWGTSVTMEAS